MKIIFKKFINKFIKKYINSFYFYDHTFKIEFNDGHDGKYNYRYSFELLKKNKNIYYQIFYTESFLIFVLFMYLYRKGNMNIEKF